MTSRVPTPSFGATLAVLLAGIPGALASETAPLDPIRGGAAACFSSTAGAEASALYHDEVGKLLIVCGMFDLDELSHGGNPEFTLAYSRRNAGGWPDPTTMLRYRDLHWQQARDIMGAMHGVTAPQYPVFPVVREPRTTSPPNSLGERAEPNQPSGLPIGISYALVRSSDSPVGTCSLAVQSLDPLRFDSKQRLVSMCGSDQILDVSLGIELVSMFGSDSGMYAAWNAVEDAWGARRQGRIAVLSDGRWGVFPLNSPVEGVFRVNDETFWAIVKNKSGANKLVALEEGDGWRMSGAISLGRGPTRVAQISATSEYLVVRRRWRSLEVSSFDSARLRRLRTVPFPPGFVLDSVVWDEGEGLCLSLRYSAFEDIGSRTRSVWGVCLGDPRAGHDPAWFTELTEHEPTARFNSDPVSRDSGE